MSGGIKRGMAATGVLVAIVALAVWFSPWAGERRLRKIEQAFEGSDVQRKLYAMRHLGSIEHPRARELAHELLTTSEDRDIREAAAYAIHNMDHADAYEQLRAAAEKEPPSWVKGKMIIYAARAGGDRALPWLHGLATDKPSWSDLGGALARIEFGDATAGPVALSYLKDDQLDRRVFASTEVSRWVRDMAEAIGRPLDLPPEGEMLSPQQIDDVIAWWRQHVTPKLLNDNVAWSKSEHPLWHRVRQLMRNRARAIRVLNIG